MRLVEPRERRVEPDRLDIPETGTSSTGSTALEPMHGELIAGFEKGVITTPIGGHGLPG
jgi:hypothetical protein